jgi:propionyl-CoA carboxylase alpha chain
MPGTVMAVLVAVGDRVSAGTTLVILEAMKMEHHISAPADGTVSDVHVTAGQQVENGAALLVLESEEPEEESA